MRYYIADLHFCHENLNTRMDCRGFESGEAMNEYMIAQWNSRVRKRHGSHREELPDWRETWFRQDLPILYSDDNREHGCRKYRNPFWI